MTLSSHPEVAMIFSILGPENEGFCVASIAIALASLHLNYEGHFFVNFITSCLSPFWPGELASDERIKEKMDSTRLQVADWIIRILACGLTASTTMCVFASMMYKDSAHKAGLDGTLLLMTSLYGCLLPFALGIFELSIRRLKITVLIAYFMIFFRTAAMAENDAGFFVLSGLRMTFRMICGIMLATRWVNLFGNTIISAAQIYKYQTASSMLSVPIHFGHFVAVEAVAFFMILGTGYLTEVIIHSRVSELCEEEASRQVIQHSLHANRKMLTVLCDADVELDEDRKLIGENPKLGHMLMTSTGQNSGFSGKLFEDFIRAEDRNRFNDFISSNTSVEVSNTPSCVQVVMQGAAGLKFQVELFHVPVVTFVEGADACSHLIGIKEVESMDATAHRNQATAAASDDIGHVRGHQTATTDPGDVGSIEDQSSSAWTSVSQREVLQSASPTSKVRESALFTCLKSVQIQVDAHHPALPMKSILFTFTDDAPSRSLRTYMPDDSSNRLYSWLVLSVVSLQCGKEPNERKLQGISMDFGSFGRFVAGEVCLEGGPAQEDQRDGSQRWMKLICEASSVIEF
eukprot:TRINITY_DN13061_c0_g1_i1.p1 TRINITY_DN13061_c0_g1~~TRINITY_DN13061_c0_g1_i1.p1  ORF type:complete len:574 (-),score=93.51 TRINITY_DN13061_c0_g1_i1:291-2012(-)